MIIAAIRLAGACAGAAIAELEVATATLGATLRIVDNQSGLAGAQVICVVGGAEAALDDELARTLRKTRAPVLGICGGAGALVRAGLLDAALIDAPAGAAHCIVEGRATAFTAALPAGRALRLGDAHVGFAVGAQAEGEGRVLLRGCRADGEPEPARVYAVGGPRNLVGVSAHLGDDGATLLRAAQAWLRKTPARIDLAR
jgi:hypothetical protein